MSVPRGCARVGVGAGVEVEVVAVVEAAVEAVEAVDVAVEAEDEAELVPEPELDEALDPTAAFALSISLATATTFDPSHASSRAMSDG